MPPKNPFEKMGLQSTSRETPHANYEQLMQFRVKAIEMGHASLATAGCAQKGRSGRDDVEHTPRTNRSNLSE
jgi:hypothetical protein